MHDYVEHIKDEYFEKSTSKNIKDYTIHQTERKDYRSSAYAIPYIEIITYKNNDKKELMVGGESYYCCILHNKEELENFINTLIKVKEEMYDNK